MTLARLSRHTSVLPLEAPATVVLVRGGAEVTSWALDASTRPDLAIVNELAHLALTARRMGCSIRLRDVSADLLDLLELVGLKDCLTGRD
jgi:ABC-type transporter Mla MlaB component